MNGSEGAPRGRICEQYTPERAEFIREVLERVGDKWSLLVIATLQEGPLRYTDLQRAIPGVSQRMLTLKLTQLRRDGLIVRQAFAEVPPRVEYDLTPLGASLLDITFALVGWSATHYDEIHRNRREFDREDEQVALRH